MTLGLRFVEPYNGLDSFLVNPLNSLINGNENYRYNILPTVDVYEKEDRYVISAELPGLNKNEIKIDFNNNVLTISGEKKAEYKEEKDNFIRVERRFGKFERKFRIPEHVDSGKISAAYKDGILEISLPRREESKPRQVEII